MYSTAGVPNPQIVAQYRAATHPELGHTSGGQITIPSSPFPATATGPQSQKGLLQYSILTMY